jgi:hypothetical protein
MLQFAELRLADYIFICDLGPYYFLRTNRKYHFSHYKLQVGA